MKLDAAQTPIVRLSLLLATILAIFVSDLLVPLGTVVWALYSIPLLLSVKLVRWWAPLACAMLCTALILLGFYFSHPSQAFMKTVMFNRLAGIAIMWAMALILVQCRRLETSLTMRTEQVRLQTSLLNEAHDAIFVRDLEDRILYWNRGAAERYGWFEKEAIGRTSHELLGTQFPEPLHDVLGKTIRDGHWEGEVQHRTRNGETLSVLSRWTVQRDADGQARSILEINTDVTDLKQTQKLWREATLQLTTVFNSSPLPILVMTPEGRIRQWNSSAEHLFGWTAEEAIGRICPTVPEDGLDDFHWMIEQALTQGHLHELVRRRKKKNGSVIQANIFISSLPGQDGKPLGVVAILEDITERRLAEEEIAASERRLRTILETEPECVKVTSEDGKLLYMNPAGLAMIEAEGSGQVLGQSVYPLIAPAYREAFVEFNRRVFHGEPSQLQFEIVGLKGRRLWMDTHAIPLKNEDNVTVGVLAITRDFTERRQHERKTQEYNMFIHQILDSSPDCVKVLSLDGQLQFINKGGQRLLEIRDFNSVFGSQWLDFWKDEHRQQAALAVESARRGDVGRFSGFSPTKTGTPKWWDVLITPLLDSDGKPERLLSISRDITEHKQAEEALREARERFEEAFQHAAIGMALVSPDGRFLQVNRSLCSIVGYSEQELLATSFQAITHPDDLEADLSYVRQMLIGEIETYQMEKRYFHKQGHIVWILLSVTLVHDPNGAPRYFVGQIQDINDRKVAEEALRESETQVRLFMEATSDCIWMWDLPASHVTRNSGFERAFGYKPADIDATIDWWTERVHPDDRERVMTIFYDAVATGGTVCAYDYRFLHRDGSYAIVNDRAFILRDDSGQFVRAYGAMTDITERKRAEEALRASEDALRTLLHEREQLMRDLHDGLIQSLYAIGLSLEECQGLTEENIKDARKRLGETVNDVNDVIRHVRQHLAPSDAAMPFSAGRLKTELRRVATAMERADSMKFDLQLDTRAAACLTTEERREILYIAQEAMSNSLRHSSASTVRVALRMERDRVRLEVEDNGGGFNPQAVHQAGNGLRNIEERADRIGARVEFVSRLKHGTRVRLDVPIREESSLGSRT